MQIDRQLMMNCVWKTKQILLPARHLGEGGRPASGVPVRRRTQRDRRNRLHRRLIKKRKQKQTKQRKAHTPLHGHALTHTHTYRSAFDFARQFGSPTTASPAGPRRRRRHDSKPNPIHCLRVSFLFPLRVFVLSPSFLSLVVVLFFFLFAITQVHTFLSLILSRLCISLLFRVFISFFFSHIPLVLVCLLCRPPLYIFILALLIEPFVCFFVGFCVCWVIFFSIYAVSTTSNCDEQRAAAAAIKCVCFSLVPDRIHSLTSMRTAKHRPLYWQRPPPLPPLRPHFT